MFRITILVCSLIVSGCEAVNCIVNTHPEFSKNSLRDGTLNQVFEDIIKVSISNSYEDDDYDFTFDLDGDLPQGISYETSPRQIRFSGTPTELGDFPLQLSVVATGRSWGTIYEPEMAGELCSDNESRDMVFSVVQGF